MKNKKLLIFITVLATLLYAVFCVVDSHAAGICILPGNMSFTKNVKTIQDLKFKNVVKQTKEYSCGAAALSTVLTYYFGKDVSEGEILRDILEQASLEKKEQVAIKGVSLLDLKKSAEALGYKGTGLRLPADLLEKLDRPAIALVNNKGYSHYVVLKGVKGNKAFIADPAMGNQVWDRSTFVDKWNGILLLFSDPANKEINSHALEIAPYIDRKKKPTFLANQFNLQFVIGISEF